MTWPAPIDQTIPAFLALQTPVTLAPSDPSLAGRRNVPSHIGSADSDLRSGQPEHGARDVRQAPHDVPVSGIDGSRMNADQHLAVPRH